MEDVLTKAAKAGGEILKKYFKTKLGHIIKSTPGDFLTKADLESQEIIVKTLQELLEKNGFKKDNIGFIGEENLIKTARHMFIIDPLDGTSSFIEKGERFCISIAYAKDKKVLEGIVYHPITKTIYYAKKGNGSFLIKSGKRKKIIMPYTPLSKSTITMHISSSPPVATEVLKTSIRLVPEITRLREKASVCLSTCEVAINRYQSDFNGMSRIWDLASAKLIIEEAGGIMTDWAGKKIEFDFHDSNKLYQTIVGHKKLISEIIPYFRKHE